MGKLALAERITTYASDCAGDAGLFYNGLLAILADYSIQELDKPQVALQTHVEHFAGAKRIEGLSDKTLHNYTLYLRRFAASIDKDADAITADDIRLFIGTLSICENSLQTVLGILRSFFGWLTREEIIRKNPMLKIPGGKKPKKRLRRAFSAEALERLRNCCDTPREKALLEFLYSTGCRVSEVAQIDLTDIDMEHRSARVIGKGDQERVVYFSVRAMLFLKAYLVSRQTGGHALFANLRGSGRMSVRSIQKLIHELGCRAALKEKSFPHKFRHTMATDALNNGMSITALQKILGHRQISTTQVYAEQSLENVRYEYERFIA